MIPSGHRRAAPKRRASARRAGRSFSGCVTRHDEGVLLTLTTTHEPATDLGYLLVKHPDRMHSASTAAGTAYVWYPEATAARCTAALLLDVDPVGLARPAKGTRTPGGFALGRYVNDRPYAASSLLTVAMGRVFRTAMNGRSNDRPDLAQTPIPLEIEIPALPCRGGPDIATRLFAPLGWSVEASPIALDPEFPEWGDSRYVRLRLTGTLRLADALNHLYVLLPVLDDAKHYWVSAAEVDKLLNAGEGWLPEHPAKELIIRRYLAGRRSLTMSALERLRDLATPEEADDEASEAAEVATEDKKPLVRIRKDAVLAALAESGATSVLDLGCGPGALLMELAHDRRLTRVVGVDVSTLSLHIAKRRLKLDQVSDRERDRITLLHSALTYHDDRLIGYDAAVLMEVIEHVDEARLPALARAVFGHAAPQTVIVTTPNVEYNVRYAGLTGLRHSDHRFEWTRAQFASWAQQVASDFGYAVEIRPVGDLDDEVGAPTQLACFQKETR